MTIFDLVANIDRRLAELESELGQLTSAQTALLDGAPSAATPAPARSRRPSAPPTPDTKPTGQANV